jgi:hypothetical protein
MKIEGRNLQAEWQGEGVYVYSRLGLKGRIIKSTSSSTPHGKESYIQAFPAKPQGVI